jgi:predicted nucleic-acid-binding protein
MRAIDTNVLTRLITRDDARQVAAAENYVSPGAWVSHLVLAETVWVLESVYRRQPREIAATVELLLDSGKIAIQDPAVVAAALATFRESPAVGFTDCLILETARKNGHLPLGTFDCGLAKHCGVERLTDRQ